MDREIQLSDGQIANVDEIDFLYILNKGAWQILKSKDKITCYARQTKQINYKKTTILMHTIIAERMKLILLPGQFHDHKDRNGLNNKRNNIRVVWPHESIANRNKFRNTINKYIGVRKIKSFQYEAYIYNNRQEYLGIYSTEEMAARVYDTFAKLYHGKFAVLNFPNE